MGPVPDFWHQSSAGDLGFARGAGRCRGIAAGARYCSALLLLAGVSVLWLPAVLALLCCFAYTALAGFSVATQRALLMLSCFLLAALAGTQCEFRAQPAAGRRGDSGYKSPGCTGQRVLAVICRCSRTIVACSLAAWHVGWLAFAVYPLFYVIGDVTPGRLVVRRQQPWWQRWLILSWCR